VGLAGCVSDGGCQIEFFFLVFVHGQFSFHCSDPRMGGRNYLSQEVGMLRSSGMSSSMGSLNGLEPHKPLGGQFPRLFA
jgi:hypothetical protein